LQKNLNRTVWSKEPCNLYVECVKFAGAAIAWRTCLTASHSRTLSRRVECRTGKNSYKYSGLANRGANVGVVEQDGAVAITLASKKNGIKTQKTAVKKNARRAAHAAGAVASKVRPDLVKAAKAKASALSRGLRARKALA
jgi:hypothetical protein